MRKLWHVILPWSWDGEASDEEGTYSTTVEGADEGEALRKAAEEMADSNEKDFDGDDERESYIESRIEGWSDVTNVADQLASDFAEIFAEELFPDGRCRAVNLQALAKLVQENRAALVR